MNDHDPYQLFDTMLALKGVRALAKGDRAYERACKAIEDMDDCKITFRGVPIERFGRGQLIKILGYSMQMMERHYL